jgi:hypothetical protein
MFLGWVGICGCMYLRKENEAKKEGNMKRINNCTEKDEMLVRLWLKFLRSGACDREVQYVILAKVRDKRNSLKLLFKTEEVLERWEVSSVRDLIRMLREEWELNIVEIQIDDIFRYLKDEVYPEVYPILIYGYQTRENKRDGMFFFIPSSMKYEEDMFLWVNVPENHPFLDGFWEAEEERSYGLMLLGVCYPNLYVSSTFGLTYLVYKEAGVEIDIYGEIVASDGKAWAVQYMAPFWDMITDARMLVSYVMDYIYYPLDTFTGLFVYRCG